MTTIPFFLPRFSSRPWRLCGSKKHTDDVRAQQPASFHRFFLTQRRDGAASSIIVAHLVTPHQRNETPHLLRAHSGEIGDWGARLIAHYKRFIHKFAGWYAPPCSTHMMYGRAIFPIYPHRFCLSCSLSFGRSRVSPQRREEHC